MNSSLKKVNAKNHYFIRLAMSKAGVSVSKTAFFTEEASI